MREGTATIRSVAMPPALLRANAWGHAPAVCFEPHGQILRDHLRAFLPRVVVVILGDERPFVLPNAQQRLEPSNLRLIGNRSPASLNRSSDPGAASGVHLPSDDVKLEHCLRLLEN